MRKIKLTMTLFVLIFIVGCTSGQDYKKCCEEKMAKLFDSGEAHARLKVLTEELTYSIPRDEAIRLLLINQKSYQNLSKDSLSKILVLISEAQNGLAAFHPPTKDTREYVQLAQRHLKNLTEFTNWIIDNQKLPSKDFEKKLSGNYSRLQLASFEIDVHNLDRLVREYLIDIVTSPEYSPERLCDGKKNRELTEAELNELSNQYPVVFNNAVRKNIGQEFIIKMKMLGVSY